MYLKIISVFYVPSSQYSLIPADLKPAGIWNFSQLSTCRHTDIELMFLAEVRRLKVNHRNYRSYFIPSGVTFEGQEEYNRVFKKDMQR